jgi:hypothetical protein
MDARGLFRSCPKAAPRPAYHPMTQGKIERYHRCLKNRILLEHYYLPGQLEARLAEFVDFYNHRRYHESLGNLTPADIYCGRGPTILQRRQTIKTADHRAATTLASAGRRLNLNPRAHFLSYSQRAVVPIVLTTYTLFPVSTSETELGD